MALAAGCSKPAQEQPVARQSQALTLAGLVAAYGFEEGSGTRFGDASGNGNVGEISGASWVTSGKYGKALSFDGVDDWATIADAASLQLSEAFTLEAWVKPASLAAEAAVIGKETPQSSVYALYARGSTTNPAAIIDGTTSATGSSALPTNSWSHLAATWDGDTLRLFVNGDLESSTPVEGPLFTEAHPLRLGGNQLFAHWFNGVIDEVLIFDHARSETQIESDMTTPIGGPLPGPVAAFGFEEGTGTTVADATGHGHSGTISGAMWESSGKYGNALSFDGIDDWVTIADAADLDFTTRMTISAWVKITSMDGWALVVAKEDTSNVAYSLFSSNDLDEPGGYFVSNETYVQAWGGGPLSTDTWHHIATTYDGTVLNSYIDGKLISSTASSVPIDVTSGPLVIGGSSVTGEAVHGLIDEVRIYDRALSAREIGIDSSTPVTASRPPLLVAAYGFEENTGTAVADSSGTNNPGTITGATWTTAGKYGNALAFDGIDDWVSVAHDTSLDLRHTMTLMAWVKPATLGEDWSTVILKEYESEGLSYALYANDFGDTPPAGYIKEDVFDLSVKAADSLPVDTWKHLAFTYDGSAMSLYVDGRLVGARAQGGTAASGDGPIRIGGNEIWGEFFEGIIDEVGIYDGALTEAQIRSAMSTPIGSGGGCGGGCDDGNVCNGAEACVANACQPGTPLTVDDGNPCTADACHPVNGVTHTPVAAGTSCANATVCDGAETCNASGTCVAGTPPPVDDANPCTIDACDPVAGVTHTPVAVGVSCADSNVCNGVETCDAAGTCFAGTPVTIDDSNPCTVDVCDALSGVSHTPVADGSACGDLCSGVGACNDGVCDLSGPAPVIDDHDPCTQDICDPETGLVTHVDRPFNQSFWDGCRYGWCNAGGFVLWWDGDDGDPCTEDICNPEEGTALHLPRPAGASCDSDQNQCNGVDFCTAEGECVVGTPQMDDQNPCTLDECVFDYAIEEFVIVNAPAPAKTICGDDDEDPCNGVLACNGAGDCSQPRTVDDGNPCTVDSCSVAMGITNVPVAAGTTCSDENACNGIETCDAVGQCQDGTPVNVDDGNPCTNDFCVAGGSVIHEPVATGTLCADANQCNGTETCDATGQCTSGVPPITDDGNPCTIDTCVPASGVQHVAHAAGTSCSNNDVCDGKETCNGSGVCESGAPLSVDDGDPCTLDSCDATSGVAHTRVAGGTACGAGQFCDVAGACTAPPMDPLAVAPPNDNTRATTILDSTSFLYTGANPIQVGMIPGTIRARQAAVLRGRVMGRNGQPLAGVGVSIKDRPEFGGTLTRADGAYDLAVNGGEVLTLQYERSGVLPVQRSADVPWQDFVNIDDVAMTSVDPLVTEVTLGGSAAIAHGTATSDADGTRRATLIFQEGTQATMLFPDGEDEPLDVMNVRLTEYTVGADGPQAMPGPLPPTSGYTYAVELSADEALAAGAKHVQFDRPAALYVDNFLDFPVGTRVPTGYYDFDRSSWVGEADGITLAILSTSAGVATLDVDGLGIAASEERLSELGITAQEREILSSAFSPGATLWRTPVAHFSSIDCNWPNDRPEDAEEPGEAEEDIGPERWSGPTTDKCEETGSRIGVAQQTVGESVPVAGTPFSLAYNSRRVIGFRAGQDNTVVLTGATVPASLVRVELDVSFGGRTQHFEFEPAPNLVHQVTWDGTDAYSRPMYGATRATFTVRYVYPRLYQTPIGNLPFESFNSWAIASGYSFNRPPTRSQYEYTISRTWTTTLDGESVRPFRWDARGAGLGGWTLDVHHMYDPTSNSLLLGSGDIADEAKQLGPTIYTVAGGGNGSSCPANDSAAVGATFSDADNVIAMPDGSFLVVARCGSGFALYRVDISGVIRRVQLNGDPLVIGAISVGSHVHVARENSNSIIVAYGNGIRRVEFVGPYEATASTIAGFPESFSPPPGSVGDNIPASQAWVDVSALAVGPDGTIYWADRRPSENGYYVRRLDPDGIVRAVTARGYTITGDGGPAIAATTNRIWALAVAPDGSLYVGTELHISAQEGSYGFLHRITPDGIINVVAGEGAAFPAGVPADTARLSSVRDIAITPDGGVYLVDGSSIGGSGLLYIDSRNIIRRIAGAYGDDASWNTGDNGPAAEAQFTQSGLELEADGSVLIASGDRIRRIAETFPGVSSDNYALPSANGDSIYHFDSAGRHLFTSDALTGVHVYSFAYNAAGHLASVTDRHGNTTQITRDGSGSPTAIVGPFGQATELELDDDGYLERVTDPLENSTLLHYAPGGGGLLTELNDARGSHLFEYDLRGRLTLDQEPDGASKTLDVLNDTDPVPTRTVTRTTAEGHETSYTWMRALNGNETREVSEGDLSLHTSTPRSGGVVMTAPDGTETEHIFSPDPRFGTQSLYVGGAVETTPAGLARNSGHLKIASPNGDFEEHLTQNGELTTVVYQASTRTFTAVSPEGRTATRVLNSEGKTTRVTAEGMLPLDVTYDASGRLSTITQGTRTTTYGYAPSGPSAGFLQTLTDPLEAVATVTRDAIGRTLSHSYGGATVSFSWDALGNLTSVTPPGKPTHSMTYTAGDLLDSYTPPGVPGGGATAYVYDLDRRLTSETRADGTLVGRDYDDVGRLEAMTIPGGALSFEYGTTGSNKGHLSDIVGPYGVDLQFLRDGRLLRRAEWSGDVGGAVDWTFTSGFQYATESVQGSSGSALSTSFGYDRDGLLVCASPTSCATVGADALEINRSPDNGLITEIVLGSTAEEWDYNGYGELASQTATAGGSPVAGFIYDEPGSERDGLGRIVRKTETIAGTTRVFDYEYDPQRRLTHAYVDGVLAEHFTYDPNGNRVSASSPSSGTLNATHDDQDRLLTYGGWTFTYTANGELQSKSHGTTGEQWTYEYDALGNLLTVVRPNGAVIEYLVDGLGRRVGKIVNGSLVSQWLYRDALKPVAELDGNGNVVAQFVYGSRLNVPDYIRRGTATYRVISDQLGSPRYVVNVHDSSDLPYRADYSAFGDVTGTGLTWMPFGFAGGLYDPDTGLVRFGARDYDPSVGRWTAKDPITWGGGQLNFYAYSTNDPVNVVDPSGTVVWVLPVAGALVGAGAAVWSNWSAYQSGQITGVDLAAIALFGAGTGALAAMPTSILGGVVAGGVLGGANDAFGQLLNPGACGFEWDEVGESVVLGSVAGFVAGAGAKAGSQVIRPREVIGSRLPREYVNRGAVPGFSDFGSLGGIVGNAVGTAGGLIAD